MLANSLYLKNPENPNKNNETVLNFLKSVGSPNFKTIVFKISDVMGSFLLIGLLNNLLPPSSIRFKNLSEQGLFLKFKSWIYFIEKKLDSKTATLDPC
jgi:hypothetical protein